MKRYKRWLMGVGAGLLVLMMWGVWGGGDTPTLATRGEAEWADPVIGWTESPAAMLTIPGDAYGLEVWRWGGALVFAVGRSATWREGVLVGDNSSSFWYSRRWLGFQLSVEDHNAVAWQRRIVEVPLIGLVVCLALGIGAVVWGCCRRLTAGAGRGDGGHAGSAGG